MTRKVRTAILISGTGSNMAALLDAASAPHYPAAPVLVLSNKASAKGLETAREKGIEAIAIPHRDYPSREAFESAVTDALRKHHIEFIVLAGFMRVLTASFVTAWAGRMVNIHPSLLPAFPGANAHAQVLKSSTLISGCTVHAVTAEVDGGPIIAQAAVPRLPEDTEATLAARVQAAEHVLYPLAVAAYLRPPGANAPMVPDVPGALLSLDETRHWAGPETNSEAS